ncbi:MAG TPA: DUF1475 family protein [Phycisphaerales bacterium]|jgi:hypothetical protein|nr:DUF1475 family protein [Phycisphaerales bacterium]
MQTVRIIGLIAMGWAMLLVGLIVRSSLQMSLGAGLRATVDTWWGVTTMVDLYAGLAIVAGWVAYRERSAARAAPWILGLVLLGNLATLAYLATAAMRSNSVDDLIGGRS